MKQKITPCLWFDQEAGAAADFYLTVFPSSKIKSRQKIEDTPSGTAEIIALELFGQDFTLMSAGPYFKITEAISFIIDCEDQAEVDYYWEKLSAHPESEQCGWLKDKFGVSWQVVPRRLPELMSDPDKEKAGRATQAMMKMKKIDIAELERAAADN